MKNSKIVIGIAGIILLGIVLFVLNLFVGSVMVPIEDIFKVLLKENTDNTLSVIIFNGEPYVEAAFQRYGIK